MMTMADDVKLGPTGQYPHGKLVDNDAGELQFGLTVIGGNVVLHFGTEVSWIGMRPEDAERVGNALLAKAKEARGG
jgi:hypothetical protein